MSPYVVSFTCSVFVKDAENPAEAREIAQTELEQAAIDVIFTDIDDWGYDKDDEE